MADFLMNTWNLGAKKINRAIWSSQAQIQLGKFRETGDPACLEESVRLFEKTLNATPRNHSGRALHLANFGIVLNMLFVQTGETANLAVAARMLREAVAVTRPGHRYRAGYLFNLGLILYSLFDQAGELDILTEALQAHRDALAATPGWSLRRANRLFGLSLTLGKMFEHTGDPGALDEAVQAIRESVAATPHDHHARAIRLASLARILDLMFEQTEDPDILKESVQAYRESVAAIPAAHLDRSSLLGGLGSALMTLHEHSGDRAALHEARDIFAEAASSELAPATDQCIAHQGLGWAATVAGDAATALAAYESAVAVLPQIAPRRLSSLDRQRRLGGAGSLLAAEAASAAITAGQQERAIELLEQARGVLLTEAMGARGDLTELLSRAPVLATRFELLRNAMDTLASADALDDLNGQLYLRPSESDTAKESGTQDAARGVADQRRQLAVDWDNLLSEIRAIPGLEGFLLPVPVDRLREQAIEGPVVFLNVSDYRCDALILTSDADRPARLVTLPTVTRDDVCRQVNRLEAAVDASLAASFPERLDGQQEISTILAWLWDEVAEPVLEELGFCEEPEPAQPWPRIWWCPVGEMALLPLHAAGYHRRPWPGGNSINRTHNGAPAVLDRVISSYAPTIRALRYARQDRSAGPGDQSQGALIVAMPETPLAPALPGARAEAEFLADLLPGSRILSDAEATRDVVLAALPRHRIAHLSCHGLTDRGNPASSKLLLYDHSDSPLTVTNLSRLSLTNAELAFLSACSTSDTSRDLLDEAVHITAAFQLAGYRNVIGTLWPVIDDLAVLVTKDFYTRLANDSAILPQASGAAQILHHAIRGLRDQYSDDPAAWAGFIHVGQ